MSGPNRRSVLAVGAGVGLIAAARPLYPQAAAAAKPRVAITTGKGVIVVELEDKKAPLSSANFLHYVDGRRYENGSFYRAAREPGASKSGTIQGGPPRGARHAPGIPHESTTKTGLRHVAGAISLTRDAPGTATSDFFICASAQPYLDAHPGAKGDNQGFAVFGHVVSGMNVVYAILAMPTGGVAINPAMKGQMIDPPVAILSAKRV